MDLLEVEGLKISYEGLLAVDDVSFSVPEGRRFILMGRSGCGKSTILKAVGGFLDGFDGAIRIDGRGVGRPGPDRMVVWQDHDQLLPWKSVLKNVSYPLELGGVLASEARSQAAGWLEKVGLARAIHQYPHQLSGGMKMRVAIARGFASRPKVLLMDEPFSALDAHSRENVQDLLIQLQEEIRLTVLFVTHDISEAVKLGNQILVLSAHPGRVVKRIDPEAGADPAALAAEIRTLIFREEEKRA